MSKRHLRVMIASAVFGILVWLSIAMREEYTLALTVPLTIDEIPAGYAIRTGVPRSVQLRLRGDGWRLAAILLGPELQLRFPFTQSPAQVDVITYPDIVDRVSLRPGVHLTDVAPDSIIVGIDRSVRTTVPVVFDHAFSFRDGYGQVGNILITPESVTVEGAAIVLKNIASWPTEPRVFENLKDPLDLDVPLVSGSTSHVQLSASTAHVSVNVQPFAEKVFAGLGVEVVGLPPTREVILIPPKIEIVVRGGINQLTGLTADDFGVTVDYETIVADTTGVVDISIAAPEGIQLVRKRPERLQYIVRKRL